MTRCPDCDAPDAYIGLLGRNVECVNPSCARFSKKWAFVARKGDSSLWSPPEVKTHQAGGLLPYREPAKQLRAVKGRKLPPEPEREYASEKGVLRPVAPRVSLPASGPAPGIPSPYEPLTQQSPFGQLQPIPNKPGRYWNRETGREVDFTRARAGEYFDQIVLGGEGGVCVGAHYEFFRDLGGKMPQGGCASWGGGGEGVVLASNLYVPNRLGHGEEAILKRASIRLIDAPTGDPVTEETAFWLGNTFFRFDINGLLQVEGPLYRFYEPGIQLPQEPFVDFNYELRASLRVGRAKRDLPQTIVSFSVEALIMSATTRW